MDRLLDKADEYLRDWSWRDAGLLKCCLCALGILIGLGIPARRKKPAAWLAGLVFLATYIPLMARFLPYLTGEEPADE